MESFIQFDFLSFLKKNIELRDSQKIELNTKVIYLGFVAGLSNCQKITISGLDITCSQQEKEIIHIFLNPFLEQMGENKT